MAEFPALLLWTDAYLADTGHLNDCEHGRYLMLLMQMWRAPNRRFPNDDAWLARKFGRSVEDVQTQIRPILEEFFKTDGNWLFHKRLEHEWERASASSRKQSVRSKARWNKEKVQCRGNASKPTLKEESYTNVEIHTDSGESHTPPAASPKARRVRVHKSYSENFERLWAAYPVRDEDERKSCYKRWLAACTQHDPDALIAAADAWRREQGANPFRFGLLRWLRDESYMREPPVYRPQQETNGKKSYTRLTAEYLMSEGEDDGFDIEGTYHNLTSTALVRQN